MAKARGMSVVDRVGERYGRLVVQSRAENRVEPSGAVRAFWMCACDCGNEKIVSGQALSKGVTRSCGCLTKEARKAESTHGMSRTVIYRIWNAMKQRCTNPGHEHYASYGGRGIKVCDAWLEFDAFYRDMGDRPHGMTLERKDNNKGYEPGNVHWATRLEQGNNRRTNVFLSYEGRTQTVASWAREYGLARNVLLGRIAAGWPVERALHEPVETSGSRRKIRMN